MNDPHLGARPPESNGMAIAALVIGIGSMVLAIIPVIGFLAWLTSPLAILLGVLALRKATGRGVAIGGIVTGGIGLLICIAWVAAVGAAINALPEGAMQDIQQEVERAAQEANGNAQSSDNSGDYQPGEEAAGNDGTGGK